MYENTLFFQLTKVKISAEIQLHLQGMLRILRPEDKLSMAVRLQSQVEDHTRYLSVLSTFDSPDIREAALIGFDILCNEKITLVFYSILFYFPALISFLSHCHIR